MKVPCWSENNLTFIVVCFEVDEETDAALRACTPIENGRIILEKSTREQVEFILQRMNVNRIHKISRIKADHHETIIIETLKIIFEVLNFQIEQQIKILERFCNAMDIVVAECDHVGRIKSVENRT